LRLQCEPFSFTLFSGAAYPRACVHAGGIGILLMVTNGLEPFPSSELPGPPQTRRIPSDRLMAGRREIIIQHGDEEYRLRVTAAGKLILTK
jgi:hemin uptake protein HemP